MTTKHTHWGVERLTNSSGRRERWHLNLHSIRRTRSDALDADFNYFMSLKFNPGDRWGDWNDLHRDGEIRAVKLTITRTTP